MTCCQHAIEEKIRADRVERDASEFLGKPVSTVERLQERIAELEAALRSAPDVPFGMLKNDADLYARVSAWHLSYQHWQFDQQIKASWKSTWQQDLESMKDAATVCKQAARIVELEAAIAKAIKHADENGMKDWPVFKSMRKVIIPSAP